MVIKIIRKWLANRDRVELGQDASGRMFARDIRENQTLTNAGIVIKKGVMYNKYINPKTKKVTLIERFMRKN